MFDSTFDARMKEFAPRQRAQFLASMYARDPGEFTGKTPDEMLVGELGSDIYVKLANEKIVPIAAVPAGIVLYE